ncbi:acetate--CoA ligase family protein [Actinomadura xylanilytica]|uniref:acetate--CoA ligase family protein n=1 Tax=Actinomadura xylanilytica TaxID=887459 RepID=UPI00255AF345|nr:acetate--CoA ligase family protein [Actinomadura xylanilytica]MDL4773893.1 acetate--CoA ligase family protein [Actinomadura xylanilytica]
MSDNSPLRVEGTERDVSGRVLALRDEDLGVFFRPRTLAVVGASDTPGRPNTAVYRRLRAWAERVGARVHPVNPGRDQVDGEPCHRSVAEVPEPIDVAAVLVGDPSGVLDELAAVGARFAVVFASGFAELGDDGRDAQERMGRLALDGPRVLGPNTNLNAFEEFREDLDGPAIALISQSGHQGRPVFQAQELGVRVSHWAPTGNEADLEFADFLRHFADLPEVGAVAGYVEGFKDGRTLMLAADHAARRGVPVVVVKVGRTRDGASMAASHTGKLTGSDAVASAVLGQFGVTRVDGLDELLDTSQLLARAKPPVSSGVCVYAISGGTGAHMADLCSAAGLDLPELSAGTQEALHQWIPGYLRVSNPVDNGGHPVGDWRGRRILETLVADPAVGVLICPITGAFPPMSDVLARDLAEIAERTDKPICVVWGSPAGTEPAYRDTLLGSRRLAVFRTFANCVGAVRAYLGFHEFQGRYRSPFPGAPRTPSPAAVGARRLLASGPASEHTAKELLREYGIRTPREELAGSAAAAVRAAAAIGFPVVLKGCGPDVAHKSDLGLVHLNLRSAAQVREAYRRVTEHEGVDAALVCEQVRGGVETVVGLAHDELFGPTVMAGLGGVFVEVFQDVAFRVPPFDAAEAHRMLAGLRGFPLLGGARGRPAADVGALVEVIMKVQRMGLELDGVLTELDINPLAVLPTGAVALDALAVTTR